MNSIRTLAFATILLAAGSSYADTTVDVEVVKQAAIDTCLSNAQEKYGSAKIVSKPRKTNVGRKKGYGFKMKVGRKNKRMNCLATSNGATMFYSGPL